MSSSTSDDSASSELAQRVLAQFESPHSMRNLAQLYVALAPLSLAALQEALAELLRSDMLRATYRVHSPYGEHRGLEDYDSVFDIPPSLEDDDQDPPATFRVGLADIEVLFSPVMVSAGGKRSH